MTPWIVGIWVLAVLVWGLFLGRFPLDIVIFSIAFGIAIVIVRSRLSKRAPQEPGLDPPTTPDFGPEELEGQLTMLLHSSSHPRAILESELFERAIAKMDQSSLSSEQLRERVIDDAELSNVAAIGALIRRRDEAVDDLVLDCIGNYTPWNRYIALRLLDPLHPSPESWVPEVLSLLDFTWLDPWNLRSLREWLQRRHALGEKLPETESWSQWCSSLSPARRNVYERLLEALGPREQARWALVPKESGVVDVGADASAPSSPLHQDPLDGVGITWKSSKQIVLDTVELFPAAQAAVQRAVSALCHRHPRPVILVGAPRTGKSTILSHVLRQLLEKRYSAMEATPDEINAGMMFIGQLEARVTTLAEKIRAGNRHLWVAPDFCNILWSGSMTGDMGRTIGRMLRADLVARNLLILGESTRSEWEHARAEAPWLAQAFEVIQVPVPTEEETVDLVHRWLADGASGKREYSGTLVRESWELVRQFLDEEQRPGILFDCVRDVLDDDQRGDSQSYTRADILRSLARRTGLPAALLDDRQELELEVVEQEFARRVRGQPEAVRAVVDRLAMMKSGVNDPTRPLAVFLLAGPTGSGKTELAKALATWLFGSERRLVRIDMSELQDHAALDRILGSRDRTTQPTRSLLEQIREQPFSVVLLDEIEKASPVVWDSLLQVFDDGRLSDRRGVVADFRHSMILMTSNLGSRIEVGPGLGFQARAPEFRAESVNEALQQTFRAEFLNRIDRVLVFRPLSRDTMRAILNAHIQKLQQRRGLRARPWAIEWDESATEFLLDRGFSREMGARPLQRAVDRHLLTPLARVMANQDAPEGDQFLFIRAAGDALDIEFVDPDAPEEPSHDHGDEMVADLRAIALDGRGTEVELGFLDQQLRKLEGIAAETSWTRARDEELARLSVDGFWESAERFELLDRTEYRRRIESAIEGARSFQSRLTRGGRVRVSTKPTRKLAARIHMLQAAIRDLELRRPGEVLLWIRSRQEEGTGRFLRDLIAMYSNWARVRGAQIEVLRSRTSEDTPEWVALIQSFGACEVLLPEAGLHVYEYTKDERGGHRRATLSVNVVPVQPDVKRKGDALLVAMEPAANEAAARVVRRYRREPSPLVRDSVYFYRTGRIDRVLAGNFDLFAGRQEASAEAAE